MMMSASVFAMAAPLDSPSGTPRSVGVEYGFSDAGIAVTMTMQNGTKASGWSTAGKNVAIFDSDAMMRDIGWTGTVGGDWAWGVVNPTHSKFTNMLGSKSYMVPGAENQFDYVKNAASSDLFEFMSNSSAPLDHMRGMVLQSPGNKQKAISLLNARGITEINGVPLDKFFVLAGDNKAFDELLPGWTHGQSAIGSY